MNQRQECQIKDMIADGLTKGLPTEEFHQARDQIGLVDVGERIKDQKDHHLRGYFNRMSLFCVLCVLAIIIIPLFYGTTRSPLLFVTISANPQDL